MFIKHFSFTKLAVLIGVCVAILLVYFFIEKTTNVVTLDADGYSPTELRVDVGDTVVFRTKNDEPFWPASNSHPAHLEYADFDPKQPIEPGDSWSFTFTEPGVYAFHDHIRPANKGVIYVGEVTDPTTEVGFTTCLETPEISEKITCWEAFIGDIVQSQGITAAFKMFTEVYKADPEFVSYGCHGVAHVIGENAYSLYQKDSDIKLTEDTAVCGYGFYHGFIEKLLHDNPDLDNVKEFCNELTLLLGDADAGIRTNCFHGIGHGLVEEDPLPEYYWGDFDRLLGPAHKLCHSVTDVPAEVRECVDGTFNGLMRFMVYDRYGFEYNREDPLGWCRRFEDQPIEFESCVFESAQHFAMLVVDYDVSKIPQFMEGFSEEFQKMVVSTAVAGMMQRDIIRADNSDYFQKCASLNSDVLEKSCIDGVLNGFSAHGEPGNERQKAVEFCDAPVATSEQAQYCKQVLGT